MQVNMYLLTTDMFKSIILHLILFIIVISGNYVNNKKVFLEVKLTNNATTDSATSDIKPVKASLIDQQAVDQAVRRQEKLFAEKVAREKQLVQQEQKIAKLKLQSEEEAKKNKLEQDALKKERDLFKKEQDNLQKTLSKLKQQQQDLLSQQAKLDQLKQKNLTAQQSIANQKKKVNNNTNSVALEQEQDVVQNYRDKIYTKIVNNRKDTSLFPTFLECTIAVKFLADGQLASVKLIKSSGNSAYDALSEQAIYKSVPFELPLDPKLNKEFTDYELNFDFTIKQYDQ